MPEIGKIAYKATVSGSRSALPKGRCKSIAMDLALIDHYDRLLSEVELYSVRTAKHQDANVFYRLRSVPGIGKIFAGDSLRGPGYPPFPALQDFVS